MFWNRFYELCCSRDTKPNPVGEKLGISSGLITKWKNGLSYPNGENLIKIAKYFDCSIDYLVGISDFPKSYVCEISSTDMRILEKLHSLPEDSQEEIIHILNYKYERLKKNQKEISSLSEFESDNKLA